jgi:hypothetical protein
MSRESEIDNEPELLDVNGTIMSGNSRESVSTAPLSVKSKLRSESKSDVEQGKLFSGKLFYSNVNRLINSILRRFSLVFALRIVRHEKT